MKIAHVQPYDHQISGGVRAHVCNLEAHHRAMGHDVTVITTASSTEGLPPNVACTSTTVVPMPGAGSIARISLSPLVFGRIAKLFRHEDYDVVHIHEPLLPMVSYAALWQSTATTIGTIHGYRPKYFLYQALNRPLRRMMDRLDARVAVSVDARAWVERYFPGDYHIIPDGVDVARFGDESIEPVEEFTDGRPNVLFVGRMDRRKGFPYLLDAFAEVRRRIPDARLLVVGHYTSRQRHEWSRVAAERGVARDVVFVGYVSDAELPRYYRTADVFCAPSTGFEALGIVLLEAMASGVPIVATDIVGYRTVVRDGQEGILVPPADTEALAEALTTVLDDAAFRQRLVTNARQRVMEYDWPVLAQRLIDVYEAARRS